MAQCDAAGVNGSNRIMSHGAPQQRMMPNGCLGSPVLVLRFGLDRGFLMDVGPRRAGTACAWRTDRKRERSSSAGQAGAMTPRVGGTYYMGTEATRSTPRCSFHLSPSGWQVRDEA